MEQQQFSVEANSLANKTLIFGILSWVIPFLNIIFSILGIVFGKKAFRAMQTDSDYSKQTQANIGYILSWVSLILTLIGGFIWLFILGGIASSM